VQICGRVVARINGRRVEHGLPGRQGRQLFVYLVVQRLRPSTRDALIEAVWPDEVPRAADIALSSLLSKLRAAIGSTFIEGKSELRLVLPARGFVDLEAARDSVHRAESAVALREWARAWGPARVALHTANRGFLEGQSAPWIDEIRRELGEIQHRALECVASAGLGLGGPELASVERSARALIAGWPYRESGYRFLIEALSRSGNTAEALLVYESLRVLLHEDLGAAPSPETQALHRSLLVSS